MTHQPISDDCSIAMTYKPMGQQDMPMERTNQLGREYVNCIMDKPIGCSHSDRGIIANQITGKLSTNGNSQLERGNTGVSQSKTRRKIPHCYHHSSQLPFPKSDGQMASFLSVMVKDERFSIRLVKHEHFSHVRLEKRKSRIMKTHLVSITTPPYLG